MYTQYLFLLPGDSIKSTNENDHFHRDMTYTISHVFATPEGVSVFIKDKNGYDTPLKACHYDLPPKTWNKIVERIKLATLEFMWKSCSPHEIFKGWDRSVTPSVKEKIEYELTKAHFCVCPSAVAAVAKYYTDATGKKCLDTERHYLFSKEEFISYMLGDISKDDDWNSLCPLNSYETRDLIRHLTFMQSNAFQVDQSVVTLNPEFPFPSCYENGVYNNMTFEQLQDYLARIIFDRPKLSRYLLPEQKDLVNDILMLFRDLPASHSATSVSKYLTGKSKVKISKVEHLFGKYPSMIRPAQMFELANRIETWLHRTNIFTTKESYSSSTEWRGQFEFIGSRYVNTARLNEIIK